MDSNNADRQIGTFHGTAIHVKNTFICVGDSRKEEEAAKFRPKRRSAPSLYSIASSDDDEQPEREQRSWSHSTSFSANEEASQEVVAARFEEFEHYQQQQMQQQQQQQMQQQQMQQQQEVKADGSMRARDLPEGWVAVYSEAHQREYYWNRQTKETTWIPPTPTPPTVPPTAAAGEAGMEILSFPDWRTARRSISSLKRRYRTGDVLERADFALVRSLLEHHPDRDSKVGQGVTAIKLDRSLHEDASDCFWVIRVDGTAEDFSANKCFRQLQFLEREAMRGH